MAQSVLKRERAAVIELGFLAWLSVVAAGVAVPAVFAEARIRGWLGRRRNKNGLCGRCGLELGGKDAEAARIGGVLHCPNCIVDFNRDMTIGLWVAAGIAVLVPLIGGLGVAGLLPFVSGAASVGVLLGFVLSPIAVACAVCLEFRVLKKANEVAAFKAGEEMRELEAGE